MGTLDTFASFVLKVNYKVSRQNLIMKQDPDPYLNMNKKLSDLNFVVNVHVADLQDRRPLLTFQRRIKCFATLVGDTIATNS